MVMLCILMDFIILAPILELVLIMMGIYDLNGKKSSFSDIGRYSCCFFQVFLNVNPLCYCFKFLSVVFAIQLSGEELYQCLTTF